MGHVDTATTFKAEGLQRFIFNHETHEGIQAR